MKRLKLIPFLLFAMLFAGCSDDEDGDATLQGQWKLTHVVGGVAGVDDDFTPGTVVWSFNTTTTSLAVNNNNTDETLQDFMNSGTYDYEFAENTDTNDCEEVIVINGISFGCMSLSNNQLTFTQIEDDGFTLTFIR